MRLEVKEGARVRHLPERGAMALGASFAAGTIVKVRTERYGDDECHQILVDFDDGSRRWVDPGRCVPA